MGYIEKRGKASWRITAHTTTAAGRIPVQMTLRMDPSLPESVQRRDAERELHNLEKRLATQAQTAWTLRDWSEEWLTKVQGPDMSPVTVHNYRYLLNSRILPLLGDYPLEELTPAILTDWLSRIRNAPRKSTRKPEDQLSRDRREKEAAALIPAYKQKKPLSVKTIKNYYGCLSAVLTAAVRLGYLDHNPLARVKPPVQHKKKKRIPTEEEALQLIRLLRSLPDEDHCKVLGVLLALLCSLRLGEVGAIRYSDVNFKTGTIDISRALKYTPEQGSFMAGPKTDASMRTVSLPPSMIQLLQRGRQLDEEARTIQSIEDELAGRPYRYSSDDYIVHGRLGRRLNKDTPSKWFRDFARAHGFGITFHDLRHVHASILVAHGVDVAAVASRMGHSDASVTLGTYTHPFAARDQQAAAVLDQLIAPPSDAPAADPREDAPEDLRDPAAPEPSAD